MGCRRARPPDDMVRVSLHEGHLTTDRLAGGRGAWVCPSTECLETAGRRRAWERALRRPIEPAEIERLRIAFPPTGGS